MKEQKSIAMGKSNSDGSFSFNEIEFLGHSHGKPISDKVSPTSVEESWTNKRKDVNCIMCRRQMTVKEFEYPPFYCYKCEPELESVFQDY